MNAGLKTNVIARAFEIARVGARYFLFYKFNGCREKPLGVRLRLACEDLGLVFIKLGQILSTRYDLLDKEDCKELTKLLDEVPGFPESYLRGIFQADFGRQPEDIFTGFSTVPIASASISQVHAARLPGGEKVAIKVRRPDVEYFISSDMKILRKVTSIGKIFLPDIRYVDTNRILSELESFLLAEVDFSREIRNIRTVEDFYHGKEMKEIAEEYVSKISFPKVHEKLSSPNIIVMEFMEGVSVKNLEIIRNDPAYDIESSLAAMMGAVMRAWMAGQGMYFHADPHPSNILIQPQGRVALLDFGLLGHFEKKDLELTRDLFLAVYAKDTDRAVELGLKMANVPYSAYSNVVREDVAQYIKEAQFSGMGFWFTEFIRIFLKHRLPLPYQLILYGRMHVIMDGLFETALPGKTTLDILGKELAWGLRRRTIDNIKGMDFSRLAYVLSEKLSRSPGKITDLIDKYFDDPLQAVRDIRNAVTGEGEWSTYYEKNSTVKQKTR